MASIDFGSRELVEFADRLRDAAANAEERLADAFDAWVDDAYETMREEAPVETGELRDSIIVIQPARSSDSRLSAEIYPTKRVSGDHGLGFLIEYGVGSRPPNPFISRTAEAARAQVPDFDLSDLL